MAKQGKKQNSVETEKALETVDTLNPEQVDVEHAEQAVELAEDFAKKSEDLTARIESEEEKVVEEVKPVVEPEKTKKSGGTAIAILALLVALGVGGAGHFMANKKFAEVEQRLADAQKQVNALSQGSVPKTIVEMPTFDAEKAQLAKLEGEYKKSLEQIGELERQQANYAKQISNLQTQLQKLGATPKAEPTAFLLSDADFLLTNALRKVALDNDVDTAKSLLVEADNVLSQASDAQIPELREAIKSDIVALSSLNKIDQNNVMQRLAQLANLVDDMPLVDNDHIEVQESSDVSDSLADWQKNIEKSADSFLSHFIRVSDKGKVQEKAFIAPNQSIYLRENIRLRLQIAILAVPRQQNELYKQSLEAVSTWVRSYFDNKNDVVKKFLAETDNLIEQSIYIDAPNKLKSLDLLKQKLNRTAQAVEKIEIEVDKDIEQLKIEKPTEASSQPVTQPEDAKQQ